MLMPTGANSPGLVASALNGANTASPRYFNSDGIHWVFRWVGKRREMVGNNTTILFIPCLCSEWAFIRPHVYTQAFVLVLIIKQSSQL